MLKLNVRVRTGEDVMEVALNNTEMQQYYGVGFEHEFSEVTLGRCW